MYYLRSRPAVDAIKFTVDQEMLTRKISLKQKDLQDPDITKVSISKHYANNPEDQEDVEMK